MRKPIGSLLLLLLLASPAGAQRKPRSVGPRGGVYHYSTSGRKVYDSPRRGSGYHYTPHHRYGGGSDEAAVMILLVILVIVVGVLLMYWLQQQRNGAEIRRLVYDRDRQFREEQTRRPELARQAERERQRLLREQERLARQLERQEWFKRNATWLIGAGLPTLVVALTVLIIAGIHFATK